MMGSATVPTTEFKISSLVTLYWDKFFWAQLRLKFPHIMASIRTVILIMWISENILIKSQFALKHNHIVSFPQLLMIILRNLVTPSTVLLFWHTRHSKVGSWYVSSGKFFFLRFQCSCYHDCYDWKSAARFVCHTITPEVMGWYQPVSRVLDSAKSITLPKL